MRSILLLFAVGCSQPSTSSSPEYLIFQHFTGAPIPDPEDPNGAHILVQGSQSDAEILADDESYADQITSLVAVEPTHGRALGFAVGPLGLDLGDDLIARSIRAGFDAALAKNVAFVVHLDVSHFWKLVADADGKLSAGTGALDVHEWMDWNGTIAAAGQHPGSDDWQPNLLPSMCFECDRVKAMVDHVTSVIGPEIADGMARVAARPDLFGGVIIGWEAGSNNPLGYHSLTLKGFNAQSTLADLRYAQQQILHDYLERWAKNLATGYSIPTDKIFTHTTNCTQWDIDHHYCNSNYGNGPDSFWEMFDDYAIGGISVYANYAAEGAFEVVAAAAADHGGAWAMMEGTNINILTGDQMTNTYGMSDIDWETYLGRIFNHGGTMANIFGVEGGNGVNTSKSAEAIAGYQKFLTGGHLVESK